MSRLSLLVFALAACGNDNHAVDVDGPLGSPDAASSEPITAAPDVWTWVPIAGTKCVHGSETGIAINPHPGATRLVVFLQGGGSCTSCWGASETAKVGTPTHYGAAELAVETDLGYGGVQGDLVIQRDNPNNPLADANYVFVPYCTGDAHGGTATRMEVGGDGLMHEDDFWGAIDLDLI